MNPSGKADVQTDNTSEITPRSGADRSGLGQKRWAEVSEDEIGSYCVVPRLSF